MKFVGAHVSIAGGVANAPLNAAKIGAKAFGMFTKNQRQWEAAPYTDADIAQFSANLKAAGYTPRRVLPHAGYLINLANNETAARRRALRAFGDEFERCAQLGLVYLAFHPGSYLGRITRAQGLELVADSLNRILEKTAGVTAVIEATAGQGANLGATFEELAEIIAMIDDPRRIGVCLDTAHMYAAGYDIVSASGYEETLNSFDRIIGLKFLKGAHLNDSKTTINSHVDRHASLGKGELGLETFRRLMNDSRFDEMPLILETPDETLWAEEIRNLYAIQRKSAQSRAGKK
jgi:deoxyribonuclease-4